MARRLYSFVCCAILVGCGVFSIAAAEGSRRKFDVPAGLAEETLRVFAQQAGGQFVFSSEKVAGVKTHPVQGFFTKEAALERMLAGTGLRAVRDDETGALTVDRVEPAEPETEPRRRKTAWARDRKFLIRVTEMPLDPVLHCERHDSAL